MKTEIIKAEDYGLEASKANELTVGLQVVKAERELLIQEFEDVSKLELSEENLPIFKELRLKIVKNRTQGINKWHKTNKEFFLTGGKFVDAIKNKEIAINESMEEKLMGAEKHFENLEKERIAKIQSERVSLLSEYVEDASERDLASMEDDVWESYLDTKKKDYLDRLEVEAKEEEERLARIEAERLEQERIREENAKLKAEADERAKKDEQDRKLREEKERKEKEERERLQAELNAKLEAEQKAKEEEEAKIQLELNKGDADKVSDLISDLESLKIKYSFESLSNKKMYSNVVNLLDKVINFIK